MFTPTNTKCGCSSAASPSSCPNPSPPSSGSSSPPAAATLPSAIKEPRPGCFPADGPADRSAPPTCANASANSDCAPAKTARARCSTSPPNSPQPCSPDCSASTSASPSPGNGPAAETGPTTPPTTAAATRPPANPANRSSGLRSKRHSDSCDSRLRQSYPPPPTANEPSTACPSTADQHHTPYDPFPPYPVHTRRTPVVALCVFLGFSLLLVFAWGGRTDLLEFFE